MPRLRTFELFSVGCWLRLLCVLFAASSPVHAQAPEDALHLFYGWVLAHPSRGLPSPGERAELAKVLSPELIALLEAASRTEAQCVDAAPKGEKPLIVEGDLFVGNYEGATEVVYGKPHRKGDTVTVESDLLYVDNRFPKAHKHRAVHWKDRVEIRLIGGRWSVTDVRFERSRTLMSTLKEYVAEGTRSCGKPGPSR